MHPAVRLGMHIAHSNEMCHLYAAIDGLIAARRLTRPMILNLRDVNNFARYIAVVKINGILSQDLR